MPDYIGKKSFRRFEKANNDLTIDITVSSDEYRYLSMNEQRAELGKVLFEFIEESLRKRKISNIEYALFIDNLQLWMEQNGWFCGVSDKEKAMLLDGAELYDVAECLNIPLSEVEYYFLKISGYGTNDTHPDNLFVICWQTLNTLQLISISR